MSYKYRTITPKRYPRPEKQKYECSHKYRQFGYYVLGGMDITGEHLDVSAKVSYDADTDIDNGCEVDSLCDPTVGFFEVAENMGADVAMQVEQAKVDNQ